MTVLFLVVGAILLACVLYCALRVKTSFDPNQQQSAAIYEYSSAPNRLYRQHDGNPESVEHANSPTATRGGPGIEFHIVSHKIGAQEPLFD